VTTPDVPAEAPGQARVVLVIDDEPSIVELFITGLSRAGMEPIGATDAEAGLRILDSRPVDIVVCDVSMPGMSGLELVRTLRSAPETATLPVILVTGSGDSDSVIQGLAAGADDFLAKPVRLTELVARVRAHIRTRSAWLDVFEQDLRTRMGVVSALGRLRLSADPEVAASAIIQQLAERSGSTGITVYQVVKGQRGRVLATTVTGAGADAPAPTGAQMRYLIERARSGAWMEGGTPATLTQQAGASPPSDLDGRAIAPIFTEDRLVGILAMVPPAAGARPIDPRARNLALATVIDYAAALSAAIGPTLGARSESHAQQVRLRRILDRREFDTAFQPIIDLVSRKTVGHEALTRFADGTRPDVRFAEAHAAGLGPEFELAAVARAADRSRQLPNGGFVTMNVSPDVLIGRAEELRPLLPTDRPVIMEVTEHMPVSDYAVLRDAVRSLGDVRLAVDDAGAGFASLRHILELEPMLVKMDMSLVRGINVDQLRQALAAGLVYFGIRSGFEIVAEGVEQAVEAEMLQVLGIGMAQGYYFGAPSIPA
jgi:EAL domain-containing protein (putative c-di-GMP-specific phosphodiesterase class I)/DNA-binding response OmpR family regulator